MGRGLGLIGIVVVLAIVGYLYTNQLEQIAPGGVAPATTVSVIGVSNDLLAMASAERRYLTGHPKYASLDELRTDGDIHVPTRPDFNYTIDASDSHFTITATYTGTDTKAPRRLVVDDTMSITSN